MNDLEKRFAAARRRAIATDYAHLNPRQLEGVLTTEGPLLLLAGAGAVTRRRYRCPFPRMRWSFWSSTLPPRTRSSGR